MEAAQLRLMEYLAGQASIPEGARVLDAGCGLGGSSLWLAREKACRVTGVTLSPVQARMARPRVAAAGLKGQVAIQEADLENFELPPESLDAVWSIECTEHLQDKAGFFRKAARWLRRDGRVAVCAWTAADGLDPALWERHIRPVCRGFFCPSLGSAAEYAAWWEAAGLSLQAPLDLTQKTLRTWEICLERTDRFWVKGLAWALGAETRMFLDSFPSILEAYRGGALRYSLMVGRKKG